jgi:hypothetical protein
MKRFSFLNVLRSVIGALTALFAWAVYKETPPKPEESHPIEIIWDQSRLALCYDDSLFAIGAGTSVFYINGTPKQFVRRVDWPSEGPSV